jgi:hypothetical protein
MRIACASVTEEKQTTLVKRAHLNDVGLQRIRLQCCESPRRARNIIIPSNHGGRVTTRVAAVRLNFTLSTHEQHDRLLIDAARRTPFCCAA